MAKKKAETPSKPVVVKNKFLALDPASIDTGYSLFETGKLAHYGLFHAKGTVVERRLFQLYQCLEKLITEHQPEAIVVEDQFFGRNVKTLKVLSWVRGIIMLLAAIHNLELVVISNKTAKKIAAGSGSCDKDEVRIGVCNYYGLPEGLDENITDSIAIGMVYLESEG